MSPHSTVPQAYKQKAQAIEEGRGLYECYSSQKVAKIIKKNGAVGNQLNHVGMVGGGGGVLFKNVGTGANLLRGYRAILVQGYAENLYIKLPSRNC
jgi:hypothetical protein